MEVQEMEGGIIAIKCVEEQDRGWLNAITPLGTIDEDGKLTSETDSSTCIAGTYKKTQAVMGRYERFVGKVGFSDTEDQMRSDNNDVTHGSDKVKGYENITLQLEMTRENNKARLEGACKGGWDYSAHAYYRHPSFRDYTMIVAFGPDVQNLSMSTAEELKIYYGVRLERKEMEYGNPNKFRLPLFARKCVTIPNWAELTPVDIMATGTVDIDVSRTYSADAQPQSPKIYQTRLKCTLTAVKTPGALTISGTNIFGEDIEETVTLTGTGTIEYITKNYFSTIDASGIQLGAGWASASDVKLAISEYDYKIVP